MATNVSDQASSLDFLKSVDSVTISNAIERLEVRPRSEGFASAKLRCFFPELGRMVDTPSRHRQKRCLLPDPQPRRSIELFEAVMNSAKPAVVVIQEIGPRPEFAAHCGEVMTTIFKRLGAVGLVSDSGVRTVRKSVPCDFALSPREPLPATGTFASCASEFRCKCWPADPPQ